MPLLVQIPPKPHVLKYNPMQTGGNELWDQIQQNLQIFTSTFQGSKSLLPLCHP